MQIKIHTDHNIEGHQALTHQVSGVVEGYLDHFSNHITRLKVHLSDESSDQKEGNNDIRCMMEARLKGRQPIAVIHQATILDEAVNGAADKLTRMIESNLGRLRDRERRTTYPDPFPPEPEPEEEA